MNARKALESIMCRTDVPEEMVEYVTEQCELLGIEPIDYVKGREHWRFRELLDVYVNVLPDNGREVFEELGNLPIEIRVQEFEKYLKKLDLVKLHLIDQVGIDSVRKKQVRDIELDGIVDTFTNTQDSYSLTAIVSDTSEEERTLEFRNGSDSVINEFGEYSINDGDKMLKVRRIRSYEGIEYMQLAEGNYLIKDLDFYKEAPLGYFAGYEDYIESVPEAPVTKRELMKSLITIDETIDLVNAKRSLENAAFVDSRFKHTNMLVPVIDNESGVICLVNNHIGEANVLFSTNKKGYVRKANLQPLNCQQLEEYLKEISGASLRTKVPSISFFERLEAITSVKFTSEELVLLANVNLSYALYVSYLVGTEYEELALQEMSEKFEWFKW